LKLSILSEDGAKKRLMRRKVLDMCLLWVLCTKVIYHLVRTLSSSFLFISICASSTLLMLMDSRRQVRRSLAENDLTVISIFVNPAQFAPHEDLTTYPRTLARDLNLLEAESFVPTLGQDNTGSGNRQQERRTPSGVFLPSVREMYPSGIAQDVSQQRGAFVEVTGLGHQMEGRSRPTFFRGVATVVSKLFNVIQVCHLIH
jgi:hypothetical protein